MRILGMGFPEMIIVLAFYAFVIFLLYLIIKKAVKNGIMEAHGQIEKNKTEPPNKQ